MDFLRQAIDIFLHIDVHLNTVIQMFGAWTYVILFAIIFAETGLVIVPFLPGDSLIFAVGTFAAIDSLNIWLTLALLIVAAILGDTVNYWIGHAVGPKVFTRDDVRFLNKKHLERTQAFFNKHGGKTIILARFMPIIRTFAPFVAGVGRMHYGRFIAYNIIGGVVWVSLFLLGGYFFGNIPWVKHNFEYVILAIVGVSFIPPIVEFVRRRCTPTRESE